MTGERDGGAPRAIPWSVAWFSAALGGVAVVLATVADRLPHAPRSAGLLPLAVLAGVLTVAGTLQVEYRSGEDTDALDLFEAVLAPLLMATPAAGAIAVVMVAKAVSQRLRRVELVKAAFNVAQWATATAAGAWVFGALRRGHQLGHWDIAALITSLVVVSTINHIAVTTVITLAQRRPLRDVPTQLRPLALHNWMPRAVTNLSIGVLFAASWVVVPAASALFVAPLVALHRAGRAQVRAHAQQALLTGLHNAARQRGHPRMARRPPTSLMASPCRCPMATRSSGH